MCPAKVKKKYGLARDAKSGSMSVPMQCALLGDIAQQELRRDKVSSVYHRERNCTV
jgi:hypothetical protein